MFGKTVLDIEGGDFEHAIDSAKTAKGTKNDLDLDADDLRGIVDTFKEIVRKHTGHHPANRHRSRAVEGHDNQLFDKLVLVKHVGTIALPPEKPM